MGKNAIKIDSAFDFEANKDKLKGLSAGALI